MAGHTENEILASVYGRSGYHSYYGRNLVTSIAFVVFNTETEESRTAGVSLGPALLPVPREIIDAEC